MVSTGSCSAKPNQTITSSSPSAVVISLRLALPLKIWLFSTSKKRLSGRRRAIQCWQLDSNRSFLSIRIGIAVAAPSKIMMAIASCYKTQGGSPLHHHLLHPSRLRKIILSNQQITLLCDPWRVAKPTANHMQRELALQFRLPAGPHRMKQSWPTRDAGSKVAGTLRFAVSQVSMCN